MRNLYNQCISEVNIVQAIKNVWKSEGSYTAGPDGISRRNNISLEEVIKEIKLRIRRYKKVNSRKIEIPKISGGTREITVCNLYDRIAQEAIYLVINPIIEPKLSKHSYGFRTGISAKVPVAKICSSILNSDKYYTIEIDFEKCFDSIPLDKALDSLRELGINESLTLKTIKHLMYTSREYKGIGLGQGTILGPLLMNCYLHKLDVFFEENFWLEKHSSYNRQRDKHYNKWLEWIEAHEWKLSCKYYRYADDTIVLCKHPAERDKIKEMVLQFIEENLDIKVNTNKSHFNDNKEVKFLGFRIKKVNGTILITPSESKIFMEEIKQFDFKNLEETLKFMKWLRGKINYYDICNNLNPWLNQIVERLWNRSLTKRKRTGYIEKEKGKGQKYFGKNKNNRRQIEIDVWGMRRDTRTSYDMYLKGAYWISRRELIEEPYLDNGYNGYKWLLYTRQKGTDPITGNTLDINTMVIHHVKPLKKNGLNEIANLILVNEETHKLIHNEMSSSNQRLMRYRKALNLTE